MNKNEFIAAVAAELKSTKADAGRAVEAMLTTVKKALKGGQVLRLVGFGTFKVVNAAAKQVRNPQNGKLVNVPATRRPKFTPGKEFREAVKK
ncbi:MAG: HU family DNA-binding protein [Proteobacteria bacterium]|nr:HU family DNA-binding protein [Pseudomonadota bacterium]